MNTRFLISTLFVVASTSMSFAASRPQVEMACTNVEMGLLANPKLPLQTPLISISVRIADQQESNKISERYLSAISKVLKTARYDKKWNDAGIMVKMKTPDFSLETYNGSTRDNILLWKEGGRVKFNDKWYLLKQGQANKLAALLSK